MNSSDFIELISKNFLNIPNNFFNQIEIYKNFLREENKKYNLTNLDSDSKIYSDYFFNSLIPYKDYDFNKFTKIVDVGSGSGIPGILIKLMFPKIHLTIIEANSKKCLFLEKLIKILNLDNIEIHNIRIEDFAIKNFNKYDFVTSRAVAELKVLIEVCFPIINLNGIFHTVKSQKIDDEIKNCKFIFSIYKIDNFKKYLIDTINISSYNFEAIKLINTPSGYPRKWKDIIK